MADRRKIPQAPPPFDTPVLGSDGKFTPAWQRWLLNDYGRTGGPSDTIYDLLVGGLYVSAQISQIQSQFDEVTNSVAEVRDLIAAKPSYDDQIDDLREEIAAVRAQNALLQQQLETSALNASAEQAAAQVISITANAANQVAVSDIQSRLDGLNTDQVPEGTTNLYFTVVRARASFSATSPLSYNSTTGNLSITLATVATSGDYNDLSNKPIGAYTGTVIASTGYVTITDSGGTPRRVLAG